MSDNRSHQVLADRAGKHVLVLTLNRPERMNAFDNAAAQALSDQLDLFEADDGLRVAIITGASGVFSAGQDLKAVETEGVASSEKRGAFGILQGRSTKPLIAAVEGHALGGGFELCLACDMIVASRKANMGLPEAARGLFAAGGGLFRLPNRIPYHLAMELCLTGEVKPATEFHSLGLVNRLADEGRALEVALELAEKVAKSGPIAVRASKAVVERAHDWTDEEGWLRQDQYGEMVFTSEDFREGIAAFIEKREPVWRGR